MDMNFRNLCSIRSISFTVIPGLTKSGDLNGTGNHRPESPQSNITLTSATTTTTTSQKTNNNG